jgi:hypothetical protein
MKSDRVAFSLLWGAFLIIASGAVVYGVLVATDAILKLAVAVIAAAAGIITALLNHSLNRLKEKELEQRRRTEENYKEILGQLGSYIRNPPDYRDRLASASLLSWVVGSPTVVKKTIAFLDIAEGEADKAVQEAKEGDKKPVRKSELLRDLLLAMREDLGLPPGDLGQSSISGLFPRVKKEELGHLD